MKAKRRFPDWLRKSGISPSQMNLFIPAFLRELNLNSVCEHANCPNRLECYSEGALTFMIMGEQCSRNCKFCSVDKGSPKGLDINEPQNLAALVSRLNMNYVVITSVTRDDLPDGGANHFVSCVDAIKDSDQLCRVEILIPDFNGNFESIRKVSYSRADVIAHNMETVKDIFVKLRPMADYDTSLSLLKSIKKINEDAITKSGFMVGLGETKDKVYELLSQIREADVDIVTIGQYLKSHSKAVDVKDFVTPETFYEYAQIAKKLGFKAVASGPFVRSSYRAHEAYKQAYQPTLV